MVSGHWRRQRLKLLFPPLTHTDLSAWHGVTVSNGGMNTARIREEDLMARMAVIVLILGVCLPEILLARMVLKAGEIDSGKVRVGVFAEVVYGKGKRDPVSGEWEKLDTASGYIKAVDAESLTLALRQGLGKKRIAFAHIQKLLLAKSSREVGRLKAESSGVVLEAGEIDSGKVRVGAFAEVVYGKGVRDPVSGEWEKLETASGYIKAVDAEHLTLGRGLWKERIAFARIQRLILAASGREMERLKRATGVESPLWSTDGGRLAAKLGAGAGAGVAAGFAAAGLVFVLAGAELPEEEGPGLALVGGMALSGWIAYMIGVPVGVSRVDPHDRFMASLAGSVIGGGVGYHMTRQQDDIGPSVLIWPLVGAVTMSEIFRDPPEARRVSVGLVPDPKGSVSAFATLRF